MPACRRLISPFQRTAPARGGRRLVRSSGRLASGPTTCAASPPCRPGLIAARDRPRPVHRRADAASGGGGALPSLDKGILANHAILKGTPADALVRLRALGADYVALCAEPAKVGTPQAPEPAGPSLRARLLDNQRIDGLAEIKLDGEAAIRVWKVAPAR